MHDYTSFIAFVDQILAAKQQPPSSPFSKGELSNTDTSALEKQIDEMVYDLYGTAYRSGRLTPEEIAIEKMKRGQFFSLSIEKRHSIKQA